MAELAGLRLLVAEAHREGDPAGEGPAPEVEHPGALDTPIAQERDVGGAAPDVHEDRALLPRLLAGRGPGQRVRMGDRGRQLEVELPDDGLHGPDLGDGGERVEDGDLQVLALEADRR